MKQIRIEDMENHELSCLVIGLTGEANLEDVFHRLGNLCNFADTALTSGVSATKLANELLDRGIVSARQRFE